VFRCDDCKQIGMKQNTVILKKREKTYYHYVIKVKKPFGKTETIIKSDKKELEKDGTQLIKEYTGKGWEIAKEKIVCNKCYKKEQNNDN
jgi:hypothetical protein